jgi:hypothetical protein
MAWNSDPVVRDLGKYANKHNFKQAIVVGIKKGGKFQVVSYGKTSELCGKAKIAADSIFNNITNGDIEIEE